MNQTDTAFAALLDKVNAASPELWAALVRSTYVNCLIGVYTGAFFVVLAIVLALFGKHWENTRRREYDDGYVAAYIVGGLAFLLGVSLIAGFTPGVLEPTGSTLRSILNRG